MAPVAVRNPKGRQISPFAAAVFAVVLAAALTLVLFPLFPGQVQVEEGMVAAETVRSPKDVTFESSVATELARLEARRSVPAVEIYDGRIRREQLDKLQALVDRIEAIRRDPSLDARQKAERMAEIPGQELSEGSRTALAGFSDPAWQAVAAQSQAILQSILSNSFNEEEVEAQRQSVPTLIDPALNEAQRRAVVELVSPLVLATRRVNEEQTEQARSQAEQEVPPQFKTIAEGQVIMREGDIVTRSTIEELEAVGLLQTWFRPWDLVSVVGMSVVSALLTAAYLYRFQPASAASPRRMAVLVLMLVGVTAAARVYLTAVLPDGDRHFLAFALPVAVVPMVVGGLLDVGAALVLAPLAALLATFAAVHLRGTTGVDLLHPLEPLQLATAFLAAGLAGLFVVHRAERFTRYLLSGVAVAAVTFVVAASFLVFTDGWRLADFAWMGLAAGVAGLLSSLLTLALFVVLGMAFDVTTRLQLMELAQMNQPLLRRLQEEAPGTFHHSIMVGNLAERAADLVGADPLLVRVGCYYHDIGKLAQPGFYIENQLAGHNPHDEMDPHDSAKVIADHVAHGLELARAYKLPSAVQAFIPEHHGTRRVTYFYRKAVEQEGEDVNPAPFTYPGPRPQSKETAIAMLADSAEAVVRASPDRSPEAIDRLVDQVIAERLAEGQLDDADLTMRDLRAVAGSFKAMLRGIYHPRIQYPAPTRAERRALEAAAWTDGTPAPDAGDAAGGPTGRRRGRVQ